MIDAYIVETHGMLALVIMAGHNKPRIVPMTISIPTDAKIFSVSPLSLLIGICSHLQTREVCLALDVACDLPWHQASTSRTMKRSFRAHIGEENREKS